MSKYLRQGAKKAQSAGAAVGGALAFAGGRAKKKLEGAFP